ncbi:MAG: hypothetical protein HY714_06205 [Candidatus Omnitrophica bacterium]|nr:hypothetical protein [Candidatus Omnitrophota bacterium]
MRIPAVLFFCLLAASLTVPSAPGLAYIPDVGPGVCLSENCDDTAPSYDDSSYSSGGSYYSDSGSDSGYSGGYYNSYDAMMMNTAMGLMGSFMNGVYQGMSQASAQQAAYEQQMAEQRRIEAEIARQEQERLRAEKMAKQEELRAHYKDKLSRSSASIKAGIARIENMLGESFSGDSSPLRIETLDDLSPGGPDWDGRDAPAGGESAPLEIMRDDFVDANVVDLRDKTDLTVRPEDLKGNTPPIETETLESLARDRAMAENFNRESAENVERLKAESRIAEIREKAEEVSLDETPPPIIPDRSGEPPPPDRLPEALSAPDPELAEVDPAGMKGDTPPIETESIESLRRDRAIREDFEQAGAENVENLKAESRIAEMRGEEPPAPALEEAPPIEAPSPAPPEAVIGVTREADEPAPQALPSSTPGRMDTSSLVLPEAGTAPDEPLLPPSEPFILPESDTAPHNPLPSGALPVMDPAVFKGDTPAIPVQTVESLARERRMTEQFQKAGSERADDLRGEAQMQPIREAARKDLEAKAAEWKARQKDLDANPGLREALEESDRLWTEAEKEYDEQARLRAQAAREAAPPDDDLSTLLLEGLDRQRWPGPANPEAPIPNAPVDEEARFKGTLEIWRAKKAAQEKGKQP